MNEASPMTSDLRGEGDPPSVIRIMTWNIHGGVGPDRLCDLNRVVDRVRMHAPDIVAIQEIDSRRISDLGCAFDFLAATLGPHSTEARLITAPDGDYGHALVSRWPLLEGMRHDISVDGREPRAAIEVSVATPSGPLHVVAVHLGLSGRERRRQAAMLYKLAQSGPERSVLVGDFNDWILRGSVRRALAEAMPGRTHHKTFPARLPVLALDRIYCRPASLLVRSWTDPLARDASDHLPIIAELHPAPR
jgi:endonuclease/exonuclease/phosphatase family metal-dependent hydrolase